MNGRRMPWTIDARAYFAIVVLFLTGIFASLNPEGSGDVVGAQLILLWFLQTAIPIGLLVFIHIVLSHYSKFDRLNPWLKVGLSGVVGALLFSPIALSLDFVFHNESWTLLQEPKLLTDAWLDEIGGVMIPVVLVWIAINTPHILQLNFSGSSPKRASDGIALAQTSAQDAPTLLGLLPPNIGADVIYLEAELHYIRVVTEKGEALVLYNLRDAIDDLQGLDGIQIHRSFWVVKRYVGVIRRSKNGWLCELKSGRTLPISRRRTSDVKKALTGSGLST
jgi:hypothetical protein